MLICVFTQIYMVAVNVIKNKLRNDKIKIDD